jgi:hypothetical protein
LESKENIPGNMFDPDCKGCCLDEATPWDKLCPYLVKIMDDSMTKCYCCEDHQDLCRIAAGDKPEYDQ